MFKPEELELMVCGSKVLDFKELQANASYVDGYTQESQVVNWLWEIVIEEMSEAQRKEFL